MYEKVCRTQEFMMNLYQTSRSNSLVSNGSMAEWADFMRQEFMNSLYR